MSDFFLALLINTAIVFGVVTVIAITAYLLAFIDIFFGFAQENTGFAIVAGERLIQMKVASRSRHIEKKTVPLGGRTLHTWIVENGEEPNPTVGILGWLERHMGIYWVGWWPLQGRYQYEMFRTIFDRSPNASQNDVMRRQNNSNFFYVQPVEYGFSLIGAETGSAILSGNGGQKKGGNIPVDVKFSVFILIVYPEIAIFDNPVWFERASSIILAHAKNYVGTRAFDALRGEEHSFAGYMLKLNKKIPEDDVSVERGLLSELGVEIVGAAIRTIDIVGSLKESILSSTTELYRKEQEAAGIREIAMAKRDELRAELEAVDSSPNGRFVRRQRALERASESGQLIIFTGENDANEQRLTANLLPEAQRKRKEGEKDGNQ